MIDCWTKNSQIWVNLKVISDYDAIIKRNNSVIMVLSVLFCGRGFASVYQLYLSGITERVM